MAECIHGLEAGLCDSCYPKPKPEAVAPAPRRRAVPKTQLRSSGSSPSASRAAPSRSTSARSTATPVTSYATIDVAAQRAYHVTHLRNLPAIIESGRLVADARPAVNVSSEVTRELRRSAEVTAGMSVADAVPFYLSPDATLWQDIRSGAVGAHWSAAARQALPTEFVVLVTTVGALTSPIFADADAAHSLTRFATDDADQQRLLRRLHADEDSLLGAEVLAPQGVPLDVVTLVSVANMKARDEVKSILAGSSFSPKVAMYPPWFAAPDAD